ncbi:ATP-binding cassette domain-containing protein [Gymnodinialimonas sp. 2305UL16-5]|uniref:ATP-binding cassette domain-containing protein n=1 Tax=Gymnodinialimonas mytili TaxID=3126503 RepID=UPI0030A517B3
MIQVDKLRLSLGGTPILKGITASMPDTGITAIIGPNGSGKSTFLHTVAGLLTPDIGTVRIEGHDVHAMALADRAKLFAILTQSQPHLPRLTVADLVAFGRWPYHRGRPSEEDSVIVQQTLDRFELGALARAPLDTLSGGQRQRAYIAMACAQTTPYLFLDEPLSALDPRISKLILSQLLALTRDKRHSCRIVIVLHDLQLVAQWADHVIAIKDGVTFADGPAAEVMQNTRLSALYETEISVRPQDDGRVAILL